MKLSAILVLGLVIAASGSISPDNRPRLREFGIVTGTLAPGPLNAITDVAGVAVGQVTVIEGSNVRTGVTAILPHDGNIFQDKVPAAIFVANGFGKLTGSTQVEELGNLETPIILTNTLSVPTAADAVLDYILGLPENKAVESVNPVVGETNDGWLNDIRGRHVTKEHVLEAIRSAKPGPVEEGSVGAGTGTICYGFKGGIGTASRKIPARQGAYTVGVLVQTNHGGILQIAGIPVAQRLRGEMALPRPELGWRDDPAVEGSCMIVVATDAPLDSRNLRRLAQRATSGHRPHRRLQFERERRLRHRFLDGERGPRAPSVAERDAKYNRPPERKYFAAFPRGGRGRGGGYFEFAVQGHAGRGRGRPRRRTAAAGEIKGFNKEIIDVIASPWAWRSHRLE